MFGQIDIEITLAPSGVLMVGAETTTNDLMSITGSQIGTNIVAVVKVTTVVAPEGTSYKLSDVSFSMIRYDLPKAVTDAMTAVLESNSVYQFFPHHILYLWVNL